jgi:hypothetical protein
MKDQIWFEKWKQRWRLPSHVWRQEKAKMTSQVWFGNRKKDGGYLVISGARRNRLIIIVQREKKRWHPSRDIPVAWRNQG